MTKHYINKLYMDSLEPIKRKIYEIRGQRVMLDFDLADAYGVETSQLKRQVRRNMERFEGEDFMFEVTHDELSRCQIGTLNINNITPITGPGPIDTLTDSKDALTARKYWNKLKQRLKEEGNETVTNCHQLKLRAYDGKMRLTDVADTEQLFRLIQSIPSPSITGPGPIDTITADALLFTLLYKERLALLRASFLFLKYEQRCEHHCWHIKLVVFILIVLNDNVMLYNTLYD